MNVGSRLLGAMALLCGVLSSRAEKILVKGPYRYYQIVRPCRFSEPGMGAHQVGDRILRLQAVVKLLHVQEDSPLPLVWVDFGGRSIFAGQSIPGFIDRECLDPAPLTPAEFANGNRESPFSSETVWPTIQNVIRGEGSLTSLTVDPAPMSREGLKEVARLQRNAQQMQIERGALLEIASKESARERSISLQAYLATTSISLGDLAFTASGTPAEEANIAALGGEGLLYSLLEIRGSKNPNCGRFISGVRLFFVSGSKISTRNQALAAVSILYGLPQESTCAPEIEEASLLLGQLGWSKPASPYAQDQHWKENWGILSDEKIRELFGPKTRIERDKRDLTSERRIISELGAWGIVEEYSKKSNGAADYRWITETESNDAKSTPALLKKLGKNI